MTEAWTRPRIPTNGLLAWMVVLILPALATTFGSGLLGAWSCTAENTGGCAAWALPIVAVSVVGLACLALVFVAPWKRTLLVVASAAFLWPLGAALVPILS